MTLRFWPTKSRPQIAMLLPLLIAIAVIQVLPQVDLPDTAFHEDTAPIVTKSRAVSAPAFALVMQDTVLLHFRAVLAITGEALPRAAHPHNQHLPILFATLIC